MNENPIAAAHAADQYEHAAPAADAKQADAKQVPKPEVPDTQEAHEFRSEWNQDEKETKTR